MRLRAAVLLAVVTSGILAGPSDAAVRTCNLVTDPTGDAVPVVTTNPDGVDIVSADVVTDRSRLVAAIKLRNLEPYPLPSSSYTQMYFTFEFVINDKRRVTFYQTYDVVGSQKSYFKVTDPEADGPPLWMDTASFVVSPVQDTVYFIASMTRKVAGNWTSGVHQLVREFPTGARLSNFVVRIDDFMRLYGFGFGSVEGYRALAEQTFDSSPVSVGSFPVTGEHTAMDWAASSRVYVHRGRSCLRPPV